MTYQPDDRDDFLRQPRTAVIATTSRDGHIHAVPVWFLWDGREFHVITERGSVKHRNIKRNNRASLCIDERDGPFRYVSAEGSVRIQDPITYDERLALHTHYRGPEAAKPIVDRGGHENMVMLILTPERWIP